MYRTTPSAAATFFKHFCAGENTEEVHSTMAALHSRGVGAILDYAAEDDVSTAQQADVADARRTSSSPVGVASSAGDAAVNAAAAAAPAPAAAAAPVADAPAAPPLPLSGGGLHRAARHRFGSRVLSPAAAHSPTADAAAGGTAPLPGSSRAAAASAPADGFDSDFEDAAASSSAGPPLTVPGVVARTYSYHSERQCDAHVDTFLAAIDTAAGLPGGPGFAAIKVLITDDNRRMALPLHADSSEGMAQLR